MPPAPALPPAPARPRPAADTVRVLADQTGRPAPRPAAPADMPGVGAVLGKYRLTAHLGDGSTCRVYRGEHVRLPLAVAVKVFRPADERDAAVLDRLRLEAALLAGLNHPHVIRLWDFDDEGRHPYLVTELVDGRPLSRLIDEAGPLPPDFAVFLAAQVADGLEAAHKVGIVHRDVKPANVLLTRDGAAKLADLGAAAVVGGRVTLAAGADGGLAGTAAYVAPEQARAAAGVDFRADIYSLGATLYHAVCGRLPFPGRSVNEVLLKHLREPPAPPHVVAPGTPRPVSDLIVKMMAKAPADRFPGYPDLRRAMQACLDAPG